MNTGIITLDIGTDRHDQLIDITGLIQRAVSDSSCDSGLCTVYVPHTTAGVMINENADPDVCHDLLRRLDSSIPWKVSSDRHGEGNSAAHLKAITVGSSVQLLISGDRLQLGTWQGVFFAEFDGPRRRTVWVKVAPDSAG